MVGLLQKRLMGPELCSELYGVTIVTVECIVCLSTRTGDVQSLFYNHVYRAVTQSITMDVFSIINMHSAKCNT